jgi:3',5'-cyclic AMP phosphodiesterase CpdA
MQAVLQISDAHFGTDQPSVREALRRLVAREKPVLAVWSGDVTQRARRAQFQAAGAFARGLGVPHTLAIPGNHDIPLYNLAARLWWPYAGFRRAFGHTLSPRCSVPGLFVIGVNTTRPWRHKNGEVSSRQIDRVAAALQQVGPQALRIVVVHQPVWVIEEVDRRNLLRGHEAALRDWGRAGADIIMGGHIHLPYVRQMMVSEPGGMRPMWVVQAGTALSHRVRGGIANSVNLVRFDPLGHASGAIERWDVNVSSGEFEQVHVTPMQAA